MMFDADELTKAAATGNTVRVQFLLSKGVNVNSVNRFGRTPIQVMMMGNTPLAHLLLEHGADPNVPDPGTGSTPLHDAARTGFLDTLKLLICFSADPKATDNNNLLPVDVARQTGNLDVVEFLNRF
ncbi:cyclin-dependent kinase inhibitor 2A [Triplophysa rosa]|uniref:Cyclin-dependent kinase inhibitor 2A-like n=1 Tax=Triplophysa rosa TaxID=992332 RepID=A0A9W8C9D7_TRIRA|nr:cyclin-dependent kinase inhibitor 2A [Triplophysa rosa]KAI7811273.1 putative cyclin-dependent kinase inhibitor 2A-like [Triplophysa rosa]